MLDNQPVEIVAGSIDIEQALLLNYEGESIDISPLIREFNIYESLIKPFYTANILVINSLGLTSVWPIIGQEQIQLTFRTPHPAFENSVNLTLNVLGIEKFNSSNVRTEMFILKCVPQEMVRDQQVKIRRSYREMPISEMATALYEDTFGTSSQLQVEDTTGNRTLVIPNMSPSRAMKLFSKEAFSNPSSNFLFFQDVDGHHFKSIDFIIQERKNVERDKYYLIDLDMQPVERLEVQNPRDKPFDYIKIMSFEFQNLFNYNITQVLGGLENTVRVLDPSSATYYERQYNYFDDFDDIERTAENVGWEMLRENNPYIDQGLAKTDLLVTNVNQVNDYSSDQKPQFWNLNLASKALLENTVLSITIAGDSEKRVGDIIDIEFPEFGATDDIEGEINRYISGSYIIVSIRHMYNSEGYRTVMQCSKNAYESVIMANQQRQNPRTR